MTHLLVHTHWWVLVLSKNSGDDSSFLCIRCHQAFIQVLTEDGGEVIHVLQCQTEKHFWYLCMWLITKDKVKQFDLSKVLIICSDEACSIEFLPIQLVNQILMST